jgi:hypothetical protein
MRALINKTCVICRARQMLMNPYLYLCGVATPGDEHFSDTSYLIKMKNDTFSELWD